MFYKFFWDSEFRDHVGKNCRMFFWDSEFRDHVGKNCRMRKLV